MENQNSQSDPPKNAMPNSSSQPRDDQPNEAGFTSDQSESDLIRTLTWSPDIMQNNLESIFAADTTAEATSNPSTSAQPQSGQSHSQSGNYESALFGEPKWKPVSMEFNASTSQQVDKMALQMFERGLSSHRQFSAKIRELLAVSQRPNPTQAPIVTRTFGLNNALFSWGQQEPKQYTFPKPANAERPVDPRKLHYEGPLVLEETCEPDVMVICDPNGNRYSPTVKKLLAGLSNAVQPGSPESQNSATNIPLAHNSDEIESAPATPLDSATPSESSSSISVPETSHQTNLLLGNIKYVNSKLVDTQLELVSDKDGNPADAKGRRIVVCTYKDSSLDVPRSIIPNLKLRLIVPADYPVVSPIIITEKLSSNDLRTNAEDLHMKAHSRLSEHCQTFLEPISLEEYANAWDASARAVLLEYTRHWSTGRR